VHLTKDGLDLLELTNDPSLLQAVHWRVPADLDPIEVETQKKQLLRQFNGKIYLVALAVYLVTWWICGMPVNSPTLDKTKPWASVVFPILAICIVMEKSYCLVIVMEKGKEFSADYVTKVDFWLTFSFLVLHILEMWWLLATEPAKMDANH